MFHLFLPVYPERIVFDDGIEMIFIRNSEELVTQHAQLVSSLSMSDLNEYRELWKTINNHFKHCPKFQNLSVSGVSEHDLRQAEKRLGGIFLPDDMKNALRIHNGRSKFGFGLRYRSPTTDLLPLNEWYPYESEE
ncbi:hypothetical protein I4U23_022106 [Adineta vaga]|nr:hypothetical protein I4U23_022106 [Adineta vaga]